MYVLNIEPGTNRLLSAGRMCNPPPDAVMVDELPDGKITDYLYVDGAFIYEPVPTEEHAEGESTIRERVAELEEALELMLSGVTE